MKYNKTQKLGVKSMEMQLSAELFEISRYTLKIIGAIISIIFSIIAYINYKKDLKLSSKNISFYFTFYFFFPGLAILNQAIPKANNVFIGAELFFSIIGNVALIYYCLEVFSFEKYLKSKKTKIFIIIYIILGFIGSFIISYITFAVNEETIPSKSFGYVGIVILYCLHVFTYIFLFFNMLKTAKKIRKIGNIEYSDEKINLFVKKAYILALASVFMLIMLIFMVLDVQVVEGRTLYNPISWISYIIVISLFFVGFNSTRNENLENLEE